MSLNRLKETLNCSQPSYFSSSSSSNFKPFQNPNFQESPQNRPSLSSSSASISLRSMKFAPKTQTKPFQLFKKQKKRRRKEKMGTRKEIGFQLLVDLIERQLVLSPSVWIPKGRLGLWVLSSPGESPVVQVPASINCRLLEVLSIKEMVSGFSTVYTKTTMVVCLEMIWGKVKPFKL